MKKSILSLVMFAIGQFSSYVDTIWYIAQKAKVSEELAQHWLSRVCNIDVSIVFSNPKYSPYLHLN